jgi:hypothetical protein
LVRFDSGGRSGCGRRVVCFGANPVMLRRAPVFRCCHESPHAQGRAVYLVLAMTPDNVIRMKPQNLVTGLPIRRLETVS